MDGFNVTMHDCRPKELINNIRRNSAPKWAEVRALSKCQILVIYCSSIVSSKSPTLTVSLAAAAEARDGSSWLPQSRCWTHVKPANVGQNGTNWLHVCRRTSVMKHGRSYVEDLRTSTERLLPRITPSSAALVFSSLISTAELLGFTPRSASLPEQQQQMLC